MSHSIEPLDISSEKAASLKTVYHPRQRLMRDHSEVFDTALLKHIKDLGQPREDIRWESRKHLISTSICNSIGVACVWRFPVYCYKYGGASFLYVFIFLLFVIGHPLFYFEIFLGQITPKHPSGRFKMVPLFEGLGWAMCLVVLVMLLYYSILCSYFIIYLTSSVSKEFPWTTCESKPCLNKTVNCSAQTPPEKFFYFDVVGKENDQVVVHWPVFTFLSGIWITVYILLVVDIRLSKLLPTFLFIIMFLLMIPMFVGAQLTDGALRGWIEFVKPTHWNIINFELWWNALSQVLFALGLSSGITSSFGSYSQFMAPVHKDCVTICFIVLLASFLTGSIAFSGFGILGYKVSESCFIHLTKSDAGSVFVFYSVAFANLPFRQGLAFSLYFVTTLQVLFCMVMMEETLLLVVCEHFKELKGHRASALALITFFLFVCSLPGTTNKGDEFVMLLDYYPVGNGLSVISMCETFVILLIGYRRLNSNKLFKFGKPIGKYFKYTWYITPGVLLVVAIAHLITVFHPEGRFVHQWPIGIGWKIAGWILFAAVLLPILIKCGHNIYIFWYKKRKVKELFYATESVNVLKMPRFTQAPPPADRPKLVPSPAESSSTDPQPGPSRPHQKYYMLPPHYFNIQLDEDD